MQKIIQTIKNVGAQERNVLHEELEDLLGGSPLEHYHFNANQYYSLIQFLDLPSAENDVLQYKSNQWTNVTPDQLKSSLNIPAGSNQTIQYNNDGALAGNDNFKYDPDYNSIVIGNATILPQAVLAAKANVDSYSQITFQNQNSGTSASTDFVVTADNGSDTSNYADFGINSSNYSDSNYSLIKANDSYLLNTGGDLIITAMDEDSKIILGSGGALTENKIGEIDSNGINLNSGMTYRINSIEIPTTEDIERVELQNIEVHGTGLVNGGLITLTGGITFSVAPFIGYISNSETTLTRITKSTSTTGLSTLYNGINFICIDVNGDIKIFSSNPDDYDYISLGYIFTGSSNSVVVELVNTPRYCSDLSVRINTFAISGIRALIQDGTNLSEGTTPLTLSVAEGKIHVNLDVYDLDTRTSFSKMYLTSDYGWVFDSNNPNKITPNVYNDPTKPYGSALITMTPTYWKKSLIFRVPSGTMYAIYGQAEYATEEIAKSATLPTLPEDLGSVAVYIATIVCQAEDTSIGTRIQDVRPYLPRLFGYGSSSSGVSLSHHSLIDLTIGDDHTQYYNQTRGDARYALFDKGVTNGDSHDHSGGDGGPIAYNNLSGIPSTFTPSSHGNESHSVTFVETTDSRLNVVTSGSVSGLMSGNDKLKLDGIESGAQVNVNSDWNALSGIPQILNKPTIPDQLSDLLDDSTHRLVTDTEKSTWNGKQDALGYIPLNSNAIVNNHSFTSGVVSIGLSDLNDSIINSPDLGQILKWNGSSWVNAEPTTVSAGAGINLYPTITGSDIINYYYFEKQPSVSGEVNIPVSVNNNKVIMASYISEPSFTLSKLDAGVWQAILWGYGETLVDNTNLVVDIYQRSSGSVETQLFSLTTPSLGVALQQYIVSSIQPEYIFNTGDRLVFKICAQSSGECVVHVVGGGSSHYSYVNTPLVVSHNDLTGLQGGLANQYYHLTSSQITNLNNQSGTNTGDETTDTIKTKLGITTLSGSNTGDQDLSSYTTKNFAIAMGVALG